MWNLYHHHNPRIDPKITGFNEICIDEVDIFKLENIQTADGQNHPLIKRLSMKLKSLFYLMSKEYLKFLKSQEIKGEIFKNKIKQLNDFYIPLAETIYKNIRVIKKLKLGLTGGQGVGKSTISNILKIGSNKDLI